MILWLIMESDLPILDVEARPDEPERKLVVHPCCLADERE